MLFTEPPPPSPFTITGNLVRDCSDAYYILHTIGWSCVTRHRQTCLQVYVCTACMRLPASSINTAATTCCPCRDRGICSTRASDPPRCKQHDALTRSTQTQASQLEVEMCEEHTRCGDVRGRGELRNEPQIEAQNIFAANRDFASVQPQTQQLFLPAVLLRRETHRRSA